ncbi:MAG TPA: DNA translocase FtsK 4TM domain-containing protein, partial [Acidimicrobiales bacterium]|nr:DNA translocase FtsK 4TM domain-containing protein [Acidimicrobiales bacterium]
MVTTKRRPAARSRSRTTSGARRGAGTGRRPAATRSRRPAASRQVSHTGLVDDVFDVLAEHALDLWALALATVGVLLAIALFAGSLGPVGHGARQGLSEALGVGRFVVPFGCLAGGLLLVVGRPRYEPARALLGLALALVSVSGLADLAGGAPHLRSSAARLGGAGGWLGVLTGGPLHGALGGWGAVVVLVALSALAAVLFTGTTVRQAAEVTGRGAAALWRWPARRVDVIDDEDEDDDDEDQAQGPSSDFDGDGGEPPADDDEEEESTPTAPAAAQATTAGHQLDDPGEDVAVVAPAAAGSSPPLGRADQMALDLGAPQGEWRLPPLKMLSRSKAQELDRQEISAAGRALVAALAAHGVETRLVGHTVGPTVTRFELELGPGVKVARVTSLNRDIAYAMASPDVRILAPIPGRSAIGVEVPNRQRQLVTLGDVLSTDEARRAREPLEVALGRDIAGRPVMVNLADMPHILISGATGAGKSSCINSLLTSVLMRSTPEQVRLILVDPKRVELGQYNGLPHLLTQVVVDPKKAANALSWAVTEMERRYDLLAEAGMRDIGGYNEAIDAGVVSDGASEEDELAAEEEPETEPERHRLPYVLVVVDELNDLMMVAARDVEESVCRIAQMARAVGIHLVLATQRPSVDVITGVIKANIPSRLAFSVSSLADSRVILDQPGAERLIGKGDMLLLTASSSVPRRIQGPWVAESEVRAVVAHWRRQRQAQYVEGIAGPEGGPAGSAALDDEDDELLQQAMELVVRSQLGSTSMLQRKLRVGFSRAGRLMDLLERRGVVGPSEGSKARAVLMTPEELE